MKRDNITRGSILKSPKSSREKKRRVNYRDIVDNISDGVYCLNADGYFTFVNKSITERSGITARRFRKLHFLDIIAPAYREQSKKNFQKILKGKEEIASEFQYIDAAGEMRDVEVRSRPIREGGKVAGLMGISRDITERKRSESVLRENEEKYRALAFTVDSMYLVDRECRYQFMNGAHLLRLGMSLDEVTGRSYSEFHTDEDTKVFRETIETVFESGKSIQTEHKGRTGDAYFLRTYSPVTDARGNITSITIISKDITRRKQAEQALQESEERYRTILEDIEEGYHEVDLAGNYTYFNESFLKIVGYSRDELAGMNYRQHADGENARKVYKAYNSMFRTGIPLNRFEWDLLRKDGVTRTVEVSASLIRDKEDRSSGFRGIVHDVTDRKRMEVALRESEEKYRLVVENAAEAIMIAQDGMLKFINRACMELLDYSEEELTSRPFTEFIHREDRQEVLERHLRRLSNQEIPGVYPFRVVANDGTVKWVEIHAIVVPWQGRPATLNFLNDITERRRADEALKESENLYRTLIETSPDAIVMYDLNGKLLTANVEAAKVYGVSSVQELLSEVETAFDLLTEDGKTFAEANFRRTINEGRSQKNEYLVRVRNGAAIPMEINSSVIKTITGEPTAFISVIRDIAERKRTQKRIDEALQFNRTILSASPVAILTYKSSGQCVSANEAASKITGGTTEQLLSQNFRELESWKDAGMIAPAEKALATGQPQILETRIRTTFGKDSWFDCRFTPFHYEGELHLLLLVSDVTWRKQAEEAMRASEEKFFKAFQASPNLMSIRSLKDGRYIDVNDAYINITGYSREELIGEDSRKLGITAPEISRKVKETIDEQGSIHNWEVDFATKTGEIRAGLFSAVIIRIGHETCLLSVTQDITDRKRAEEALRESEANFRRIFDESPIGAAIVSPDYHFTRTNEAMRNMMGYSTEEFTRLRFHDITHDDHIDGDLVYVKRLASGETDRYETEKRYVRKDGEIIWGRLSVQAIRDRSGRVLYFLPMVVDITKRKEAEKKLEGERERLASILDGIPVPTFVIDRSRNVVLWNSYNEMYTGITKNHVLGKPLDLSTLFQKQASPTLAELVLEMGDDELMARFGKHGLRKSDVQPHSFETTGRIWIKGEEKLLIIQAARIIDPAGNILGAVQTGQDITERTQLEGQLRQAQKMEAIGTLAGGIAHDFNNILSAVLGYTEMALAEPKVDDHLRRYLDQVFKAGERARDLVRQILSFSRQGEEEPRPMRVSPIAKEVMRLLRASLPSTIKIRQDIHDDRDTIVADPTQIHQILMNLCTNAAHAMQGRKGELRVSLAPVGIESSDILTTHHHLSPGAYLKLTVSDTGIGIDNKIIDRIFDPFFTTKKPGEGTGLGLSVVYGIVKSYEGAITVESEPGKGTEFNIYLPLQLEDDVTREAKDEAPIPGGKERILFVDDEAALAELAAGMLTGLGYEVIVRASSTEALELFRARPEWFDLVITDMTMPNMTGGELAQQMLRIRPDTPVILCTGFSETMTQEKAKAIGVKEFIMKPIVQRQIAAAIRRALDEGN